MNKKQITNPTDAPKDVSKTDSIADLLPESLKALLSDESLKDLQESFNRVVKEKALELTNLSVQAAEIAFNESANDKLIKLVNKIDEAHRIALINVVENHKEKFKNKFKLFESKTMKEAKEFKEHVQITLAKFLDKKIERLVPTKIIEEAARNTVALNLCESFRNILGVDKAYAMNSIKSAVMEGAEMLNNSISASEKLIIENKELKLKITEAEKNNYLMEATKKFPEAKRNYVNRIMKDKDINFIKENLEYCGELYKEHVIKENNNLLQNTLNKRKSLTQASSKQLITPRPSKLTESNSVDSIDKLISQIEDAEEPSYF